MNLPPTEPLGPQHEREAFSCGSEALDGFLKRQARQEQNRNDSVCWILPASDDRRRIRGYYTLSAYSVRLGQLPEDIRRRLPKYPEMPAALLGRMAVDLRCRRQRMGEHLLLDAMRKVLGVSQTLGTVVLIVDAKDDEAAAFYRHFDFIPFTGHPLRLYVPAATIDALWRYRE